ncbi:MAG: tetratricopeptide repeat protein [Woeseiaceae bacterium]|nr:tetratricopeptide repeat protein [Woeseiaceae bacterium]
MNLWIIFAAMSFGAVVFAVWPLFKRQRRLSPLIAFSVIFVVGLSSGLYYKQGRPELPSAAGDGGQQSMDAAIAGLQDKLADNPNNPNGWMMLGRTYMSMANYAGAVEAYEKAVELESAQNPQALTGLGEALLANAGGAWDSRMASLFENALALDANNLQALFYGGIASANRGDTTLAADRWERLLGLNPPPDIQDILVQRIAEWRGETPPLPASHPPIDGGEPVTEAEPAPAVQSAQAPAELPPMGEGAVVRAWVMLSPEAAAALPAEATVFLIARDPAQPMPPIAASRRMLSELPAFVELGDRESMVPGRDLSGFAEFELIARVSLSGQPMAAPGDWFGTAIVNPSADNDIELSIQTEVQ